MHENKTFLTFTYISFFITYMNCCYQEQRIGWERIHCSDHTGYNNPDHIALKYPPGKEIDTKDDWKENHRILWIPEKKLCLCR